MPKHACIENCNYESDHVSRHTENKTLFCCLLVLFVKKKSKITLINKEKSVYQLLVSVVKSLQSSIISKNMASVLLLLLVADVDSVDRYAKC